MNMPGLLNLLLRDNMYFCSEFVPEIIAYLVSLF